MSMLKTIRFSAVSCAILTLVSCIDLPQPVDRQVELQTLEFRTSCLSATRPAGSKEHTDCVLARYEERQKELDRLREKVMPPPPVFTVFPPIGPDPYYPYFLI